MNKPAFVKKVKEALNLRSENAARDAIDKMSALIMELVKAGEEVPFGEAGKFCSSERAARKCRNPQTGEEIDVPAKKAVKFKISGKFKSVVNE